MRRLNLSQLKPAMKISRTIYNHRGDVLIMAGTVLTQPIIDRLGKFGVVMAWVEGHETEVIPIKDVVNKETRIATVKQVKNILLETRESGRLVIEPQDLYNNVSMFAKDLFDTENLLYSLSDLRTQDNYTFVHSVNVCILSMMTGITLGFDHEDICTLGIGGLLHDLGKVKIPDEILNKPGPLTKQEFSLMKKHSLYGYKLIKDSGNIGEIPARIALEHHENCDGSGYPFGISGTKMHTFSQIAAIADKFDAITTHRVYRKAFPPFEAYEMCAAAGNFLFEEHIVRAFMHNITPYPPGTQVELNNGLIGICVDTKKGYSLFPTVLILFDKNHKPVKEQIEISLFERPGINIIRVLPNDNMTLAN